MLRKSFLICILCFITSAKIANAEMGKTGFDKIKKDNSYNVPSPGDCPSDNILKHNTEWTEHSEDWNDYLDNILETHFSLSLSPVKPMISINSVPINVNRSLGVFMSREVVWSVNRTNQTDYLDKNNNCHIVGVVAYYVEAKNKAGWPPDTRILKKPEIEEKWLRDGVISLIELRWYDAVEMKRHRWFNQRLASSLSWVGSYNFSPILLPMAVNTLN